MMLYKSEHKKIFTLTGSQKMGPQAKGGYEMYSWNNLSVCLPPTSFVSKSGNFSSAPLSKQLHAEYICVNAGGVFALTGLQKMGPQAKVVKLSQRRASLRVAVVSPHDGLTRRFFNGCALPPHALSW